MSLRSHHGCSRCKTRRQKCDENRPSCTRCLQADVKCEYTIVLKWNGRTPRHPQQIMRHGRDTKSNTTNTLMIRNAESTPRRAEEIDQHEVQVVADFRRPIDPWSSLSPTNKFLLNHFVRKASLNAPHTQIRDQICGNVVPMIFNIPSLFYATMALAGLHSATLLRGVPAGFVVDEDVTNNLSQSIRLLRSDLQGGWDVAVLHTIRTLCVCEIYSGKADNSWRVHVNGAKAIIDSALAKVSTNRNDELSNSLAFQWYSSIEALTALTVHGLQGGQVDSSSGSIEGFLPHQSTIHTDEYSFNVYTGYSSDLDPILKEIGSLACEHSQIENSGQMDTSQIKADFQQRVFSLEQRVLSMISRDSDYGLNIPPNVNLTVEELRQFSACNRAYQFSALIHIYRKLKNRNAMASEVQDCVQGIILAVSEILPVIELSPWVLLSTPIYTAGCEAIGADRDIIRDLLGQLYETLRIRNTLRAISMLEDRWSIPTRSHGMTYCNDDCQENALDFIPY